MANTERDRQLESRASSAMSTTSHQSMDSEIRRDTSSGLPSPSPSRLSYYSDMSSTSSRTFYPPSGYPKPAETLAPGYPPHGYPDMGYPTDNLYPSSAFPVTGRYPTSRLPQSPFPQSPFPESPLPKSPYPRSPPPVSPYPDIDYPESHHKSGSDVMGSEATSLVFSEELGVSRASSEIMYPMSAFPDSVADSTNDQNKKENGYLK